MKRASVLILACCCATALLGAAPLPITDLRVDAPGTGFRHVTLEWTTPLDTAALAAPAFYELRLSTYAPLVSPADWDNNSGVAAPPYRTGWSTAGVVAGSLDRRVVTGLVNGITYFFALKSSTDGVTWSDIDTSSPEPFATPFNTAPGTVGGHNPMNGAVSTATAVTLSWAVPSPGGSDAGFGDTVSSFTVEVSALLDFSTKIEKTGLTGPSWSTPALSENTTYYWRAKAGDSENLYSVSFLAQYDRRFIVNAVNEPPGAFSLVSPSAGAIVNSLRPVLQWGASSDPDPGDTLTYRVFYSTRADFSAETTLSASGLAVPQHQPIADLVENATYYWKAETRDAGGNYTVSDTTGVFRVNTVNEAPVFAGLSAPAADAVVSSDTVTFTWLNAFDPDPGDLLAYTLIYSSSDPTLFLEYVSSAGIPALTYTAGGLCENATYWWRVEVRDSGSFIDQSGIRRFYVNAVNAPPDPFSLLSPSGVVAAAQPAFSWQAASDPDGDAVLYTVLYATAADFGVAFSSSGLAAPLFVPPAALSENTAYYWKVEAHDPYGAYRVSDGTWTATIDAVAEPPLPFSLLSPADGGLVTGLKPTLVWQATADPDPADAVASYTLCITTVAGFAVQSEVGGIALPSYTFPSSLLNHTTYFWRVKAVAAVSGETYSGDSRRFVTANAPPDTFDLTFSSGTLGAAPVTLGWTLPADPEGDAFTYRVFLSSYADFRVFYSSAGLAAPPYSFGSAEENREYFWRVDAVDSWGNTRQSAQTWRFAVNAVPEPPLSFGLLFPDDGALLNTRQPQFAWSAAVDPDPGNTVSYTLWYSTDASLAVRTEISGLASASHKVAAALSPNVPYYWRVVARGSDGQTTLSPVRQFSVEKDVQPLAPSNFRAARGAGGTTVTLSWEAVTQYDDGSALTDGAGYRIYKAYRFSDVFSVVPATSVAAGVTSWTDDDIGARTAYYLVQAYAASGADGLFPAVQQAGAEAATLFYSSDLTVTLSSPNDLVAATVTVAITRRPSEEDSRVLRSCLVEARNPDGTAVQRAFAAPVTLTFALPDGYAAQGKKAAPPAPLSVGIFWFNGVEWIYLGGERTADGVSIRTAATGLYQLRTTMRSASFSTLAAWPKIITPNGDGINDEFNYTFENPYSERVEGKIFDISGGFVAALTALTDRWLTWDGKDEAGRNVPPGTYLYQVRCGTGIYNGTVVAAR